MDAPDTVTEATRMLEAEGYTATVTLLDGGVLRFSGVDTPCGLDEAVVERMYRFEGDSDPGDEMVRVRRCTIPAARRAGHARVGLRPGRRPRRAAAPHLHRRRRSRTPDRGGGLRSRPTWRPDPFDAVPHLVRRVARRPSPKEPTAVALATADASGRPSVRFVLLKGVDDGFVFFTNYESRKGDELAANPQAALCFGWLELERQVRVVGPVHQVDAAESDAYFATRPPGQPVGRVGVGPEPGRRRPRRARARWAEAEARYGDDVPRRRTGAATGSCPTRSSSGRAGPAASTTASATPAPTTGWDVHRLMP